MVKSLNDTREADYSSSRAAIVSTLPICHCEHLKGAWQSHLSHQRGGLRKAIVESSPCYSVHRTVGKKPTPAVASGLDVRLRTRLSLD